MATKNDITGDSIVSKARNQKTYADNWERIFGNKGKVKEDENDTRKSGNSTAKA